MKTLLITTLTTALLSFNCLADNTSDIKNIASLMVKQDLHQLNTQLTRNSKTGIRQILKTPVLSQINTNGVLVVSVEKNSQIQAKNVTQANGE